MLTKARAQSWLDLQGKEVRQMHSPGWAHGLETSRLGPKIGYLQDTIRAVQVS